MQIKGVNLGNWLVLEKWMSPALFDGTTAEDEYYLPTQLSPEVYEAKIQVHRSEYITERDFIAIKAMGLDTVRIPVPYFIFGDRKPFIGCTKELDKAFNWAEKYGLKILIDLHTAPMGQNGFDNGGICGVCKWCKMPEEVEFLLSVLERLAQRYGHREGLWGIEVLNEPVTTKELWEYVVTRYPAADAQLAEGSSEIPLEFLKGFYLDAYDRMRKYLPDEKYIVLHDGFQFKAWKDFMREEKYHHVVLDTHLYLTQVIDCEQNLDGYLTYIKEHYEKDIAEMEQYFPVICGEWCLFNLSKMCELIHEEGQEMSVAMKDKEQEAARKAERLHMYRTLATAQLKAWEKGSGFFFWSYKLLIDTVNTKECGDWNAWDLGRCIDFGWFPRQDGECPTR